MKSPQELEFEVSWSQNLNQYNLSSALVDSYTFYDLTNWFKDDAAHRNSIRSFYLIYAEIYFRRSSEWNDLSCYLSTCSAKTLLNADNFDQRIDSKLSMFSTQNSTGAFSDKINTMSIQSIYGLLSTFWLIN